MRLSKYFSLGKTQYELDFVDIDPDIDTRLFLDPYFISKCEFPFAIDAHQTIRSFFEYLLALLKGGKNKQAEEIFSHLGETNDLCLGMSTGKPRGRGMGPEDTSHIFKQLMGSQAIKSGVMEDIEDFRIFVPNIDKDKVSDMTANIIRKHLIEYTQEQCLLLGIPLTKNVPSGLYWERVSKDWENQYTDRLVINNRPILLVPKRVISFSDKYTPQVYKQHFVLNFLQNENLRLQSPLVQKRKKSGAQFVTKKSITNKEGVMDKEYLAKFTEQYPEVFMNFKGAVSHVLNPIDGSVYDDTTNLNEVCTYLKNKLIQTPAGSDYATDYHRLMIGILELLLYPNLSSPKKEIEIHDGRKRIDIVFNNSAELGFFYRLPVSSKLPCPFIFVECKNYSREVKNPELDQIAGRFNPRRGRVGLITCRNIDKPDLFLDRCKDTLQDDRGLIIPITDVDIILALDNYCEKGFSALEAILEEKYRQISII